MPNNYDRIAKFYDALSRIIFQHSIVNAQVHLITYIPLKSKILIVGGGTGWILEEIAKIYAEGIEISYVEKSEVMIQLARKRNFKKNKVEFINKAVENYESNILFDVIITPFLFDNFLKEKIDFVFNKLNSVLKPEGIWLYADFVNDNTHKKIWQKILLQTMYLFFKITCNIETQKLIVMQPYFKNGFEIISEKKFYANFIQAIAYRKN